VSKWFENEPCTHDGCGARSLPLSTPAVCGAHVDSPDDWYESYLAELLRDEPDPEEQERMFGFSHDLHRLALVERGVAKELYESFEQKRAAGRNIAFFFRDLVFFVCTAAASGVIGGLSLEAIKRLVKKIVSKSQKKSVEPLLEEILTPEKYESLRQKRSDEMVLEAEEAIELRLNRTYRLLMRKAERDTEK
jgi:hypothetical protein